MKQAEFRAIENYMKGHMRDSAHDEQHVYRVLYAALDIAENERDVDYDVLIASALLHDIGREAQFFDRSVCHAKVGSMMAFRYLTENGWCEENALKVRDAINTHRYRGDNPPLSIEAKILFDADKLDAAGAMGIARTLFFEGKTSEPLYKLSKDGEIEEEYIGERMNSFFQEFNYKLRNLYDRFYTERGREIAKERRKTAMDFYERLYQEITNNRDGEELLERSLA